MHLGMVCPGTLFIGDNGAFLCIPMKIGVKFEHCERCRRRRPSSAREIGGSGGSLERNVAAVTLPTAASFISPRLTGAGRAALPRPAQFTVLSCRHHCVHCAELSSPLCLLC